MFSTTTATGQHGHCGRSVADHLRARDEQADDTATQRSISGRRLRSSLRTRWSRGRCGAGQHEADMTTTPRQPRKQGDDYSLDTALARARLSAKSDGSAIANSALSTRPDDTQQQRRRRRTGHQSTPGDLRSSSGMARARIYYDRSTHCAMRGSVTARCGCPLAAERVDMAPHRLRRELLCRRGGVQERILSEPVAATVRCSRSPAHASSRPRAVCRAARSGRVDECCLRTCAAAAGPASAPGLLSVPIARRDGRRTPNRTLSLNRPEDTNSRGPEPSRRQMLRPGLAALDARCTSKSRILRIPSGSSRWRARRAPPCAPQQHRRVRAVGSRASTSDLRLPTDVARRGRDWSTVSRQPVGCRDQRCVAPTAPGAHAAPQAPTSCSGYEVGGSLVLYDAPRCGRIEPSINAWRAFPIVGPRSRYRAVLTSKLYDRRSCFRPFREIADAVTFRLPMNELATLSARHLAAAQPSGPQGRFSRAWWHRAR